jgi:hypothetical protein
MSIDHPKYLFISQNEKTNQKNTILSEQFQIQLKNRRIRDKTDISNTYIHDYIHARLGTSNSIKSTGVKLVYGPKPLLLIWNCSESMVFFFFILFVIIFLFRKKSSRFLFLTG